MFNKKYKEKIKELETRLEKFQGTYEQIKEYEDLSEAIIQKQKELKEVKKLYLEKYYENQHLKNEISDNSEILDYQDICLYEPKFKYTDPQKYKDELSSNYFKQKEMHRKKEDIETPFKGNVQLNGNSTKGNEIIKNFSDLILSTFNSFCNEIVDKATPYSYEKHKNSIQNKYFKLNKIGATLNIKISERLYELRQEELSLVVERKQMIEYEKEEQKRQQEILREQEKVEHELLKQKENLLKERKKYELELEKCSDDNKDHIESKLKEIDKQIETDDYRLNNNKAGYCYFIKNDDMINGTIKIGITRRLNPEDRIDELGNASHAFKFSIYGMVFSDDVFKLESGLHKYFENRRVNKVNLHKEFFYVTPEEIEEALKNFGYSVTLNKNIFNEQYVLSQFERN